MLVAAYCREVTSDGRGEGLEFRPLEIWIPSDWSVVCQGRLRRVICRLLC